MATSTIKEIAVNTTVTNESGNTTDLYNLLKTITVNLKYGQCVSTNVTFIDDNDGKPFSFNVGSKFTEDTTDTSRRINYGTDDDNNITVDFVNFDNINSSVMNDLCSEKYDIVTLSDVCDLCIDFYLHFVNDNDRNIAFTINLYTHTTVVSESDEPKIIDLEPVEETEEA